MKTTKKKNPNQTTKIFNTTDTNRTGSGKQSTNLRELVGTESEIKTNKKKLCILIKT